MYRILIDRSLCSGFGACAELAPEIFEVDDGGLVSLASAPATTKPCSTPPPPARWPRSRSSRSKRHDVSSNRRDRGAGLAGARAAETLRAEGFAGRVVLVGDEPSAPYERPALSKEFLAGSVTSSRSAAQTVVLGMREIELVLGNRIESVDPIARVARMSHGRELRFDDSSSPRVPGRDDFLSKCRTACTSCVRSPMHARCARRSSRLAAGRDRRRFRRSGGRVDSRSLGVEVTIVEAGAAPVARARRRRRPAYRGALALHGVDVRLRTGVVRVRADATGRVDSVVLTDGCELRADAVLVGIGVPAGTSFCRSVLRPRARCRRHRRAGSLDGGGPRRRRRGATYPRTRRRSTAAALRLVGPVRAAAPGRWDSEARPSVRGRRRCRVVRGPLLGR